MESIKQAFVDAYSPYLRYGLAALFLLSNSAWGAVNVYVEQYYGSAVIKYQCTDGEVVRAWALDVTVDQGRIIGINDYFLGSCTITDQGYGIFPAAFRDYITVGTDIDWNVEGYTPLAVIADDPGDTLPGLGSSGVTLEFGALWDPDIPATAPPSSGTLCALQLTEGANVSIAANAGRGGVVSIDPDLILAPVFSGAFVQPPQVLGITSSNGYVTVTFVGGELARSDALNNAWIPTGNTSGTYMELAVDKGFFSVDASPVWPMPSITGLSVTNGLVTISFIGGELEFADTLDDEWFPTGNTSGTHQEPAGCTRFYRVSSP